jgi:hypothetical protein
MPIICNLRDWGTANQKKIIGKWFTVLLLPLVEHCGNFIKKEPAKMEI